MLCTSRLHFTAVSSDSMTSESAPSDLRGRRTLAAILFTDGVSFSARMAANEEHTLAMIRRDFKLMQTICQQFNGQVIKSTGDGLLMHFVSAVQAVGCALAIQKGLMEASAGLAVEDFLLHRIGIHIGDIFFSKNDVMGSGVNIAARLQSEAEPGGICISQTVYDVVKSHLPLYATCLGVRSLKNIRDSLRVYQIHLTPPPVTMPDPPTPQTAAKLELLNLTPPQELVLDQPIITLGRAPDNDLVLDEPFVSRYHAKLLKEGESFMLIDLGTADGTRLNDVRLAAHQSQALLDGDRIGIGTTELRFSQWSTTARITVARLKSQTAPGGEPVFALNQEVTGIGRAPDNQLVLSESFISRYHAQIRQTDDQYILVDLGSKSGTWINGSRLTPQMPQVLADGDVISFGVTGFQFVTELASADELIPATMMRESLPGSPADQ